MTSVVSCLNLCFATMTAFSISLNSRLRLSASRDSDAILQSSRRGRGGTLVDTKGSLLFPAKKKGTRENSPVCCASFFVGSLRLSYDDLRPVGFFVGFHFRFGFLGIRLFVDDAEYFSTKKIQTKSMELFNIFSPRNLAQMVTSRSCAVSY